MSTIPFAPVPGSFRGYSGDGFQTVHYTAWGAGRAGPTAVLLHGYLQNGREFDPLAAALADAGWRVYCPDLPGHGRSDWREDPADYRFPLYASTVATMIAVSGADSVDLVGTSMGGTIAMLMASLKGAPIRSLVLNDVAIRWPEQAARRVASLIPREVAFADLESAAAAVAVLTADRGPISGDELKDVLRYSLRRTKDGFSFRFDPRLRTALVRMQAHDRDRWQSWEAVSVPSLLLRGDVSGMLTAAMADEMIARNPRAKLATLPAGGHPPWLRSAADTGVVVAWLEGLRAERRRNHQLQRLAS